MLDILYMMTHTTFGLRGRGERDPLSPSVEGGGTVSDRFRAIKATLALLGLLGCLGGCLAFQEFDPGDGALLSDLAYVEGARAHPEKHRLDLYVPSGEGPHPVVVFLHGGGWVSGDRRLAGGNYYANVGWSLASRGFLVVVASYRLAPHYPHPSQVEDVAGVLRWVVDHAAEHGGDPGRLALVGHSSGAHLAALVSFDSRYLERVDLGPETIDAVVGISGAYDLTLEPIEPLHEFAFLRPTFGKSLDRRALASPVYHVTDDAPPFLIVVGEDEDGTFQRQARALQEAFRWKGRHDVPIELVPDRNHSEIILRFGTEGDPAIHRIATYLQDVLRPTPP